MREANLLEHKEHELAEDGTAGNLHGFMHLLLTVPVVACQPESLHTHADSWGFRVYIGLRSNTVACQPVGLHTHVDSWGLGFT